MDNQQHELVPVVEGRSIGSNIDRSEGDQITSISPLDRKRTTSANHGAEPSLLLRAKDDSRAKCKHSIVLALTFKTK